MLSRCRKGKDVLVSVIISVTPLVRTNNRAMSMVSYVDTARIVSYTKRKRIGFFWRDVSSIPHPHAGRRDIVFEVALVAGSTTY